MTIESKVTASSRESFALFNVGDSFRCRMVVTRALMDQFSYLSGDRNPIHMDAEYAKAHGLRAPVVFGNLLGALLSRLIGMELPSRAVMIAKQTLEFRETAYVEDELLLDATVASVHESVQAVLLKLTFTTSAQTVVCTGQCLIKCI